MNLFAKRVANKSDVSCFELHADVRSHRRNNMSTLHNDWCHLGEKIAGIERKRWLCEHNEADALQKWSKKSPNKDALASKVNFINGKLVHSRKCFGFVVCATF